MQLHLHPKAPHLQIQKYLQKIYLFYQIYLSKIDILGEKV